MTKKQEKIYDIVAPSSMGVRMCPIGGEAIEYSDQFHMQATSAETNVLSVFSSLNLKAKVLTLFVKDGLISTFIKRDLNKRRIAFDPIDIEKDNPWGVRHQINFADSGFGFRAPKLENDRAGEVGSHLSLTHFDLDKLFDQQGVKLLHLSGLIVSLSTASADFCLALAKKAKQSNTLISFDLNYRASFWKNRKKDLSEVYHELVGLADILIGNEEDIQQTLFINGPTVHQKIDDKAYQTMILDVASKYANLSVISITLRDVLSVNKHMWGALTYQNKRFYHIPPEAIDVYDRIGGGDAYAGGLLYGLNRGWDIEKSTQFGWSAGVLAVSHRYDYILPTHEDDLWRIWEKNTRIKR